MYIYKSVVSTLEDMKLAVIICFDFLFVIALSTSVWTFWKARRLFETLYVGPIFFRESVLDTYCFSGPKIYFLTVGCSNLSMFIPI